MVQSAARTNKFINRLPKGLKWTGRGLWVISAAISIVVIVEASPENRGEVVQEQLNIVLGSALGGLSVTGIFVALGVATSGIGYCVLLFVGSFTGSVVAQKASLLQVLDIAPHLSSEIVGRLYCIEGAWDEIDLLIVSISQRSIAREEAVLVVATGMVSGELMSGPGHYRSYEVVPATRAAANLFGSIEPRYVPNYLLKTVNGYARAAPERVPLSPGSRLGDPGGFHRRRWGDRNAGSS